MFSALLSSFHAPSMEYAAVDTPRRKSFGNGFALKFPVMQLKLKNIMFDACESKIFDSYLNPEYKIPQMRNAPYLFISNMYLLSFQKHKGVWK